VEKIKFSKIQQPFISTIITDKNPTDCRRAIWHSDYDGTDAYERHLMMLESGYGEDCQGGHFILITLKATLELKKVLKVPYIMGSHGQHSKIGRVVCPMLGSMLAWCTQPLSLGGYPLQPPIKVQKAAWENIDWAVTQPPEKQVWL
jgi:hypothetical protein